MAFLDSASLPEASTIVIISPNSKIANVIIIVWNTNPKSGAFSKFKTVVVKWVSNKITATFKKLFPIRRVANSLCGVFSNRRMLLSFFLSLSSKSCRCCGVKEKNATSEAEIMAEKHNKRILVSKEIMADKVIG